MAANLSALYSSSWSASSMAASAMYPEYWVNVSGCETVCSHGSPFPSPLDPEHVILQLCLPKELGSATLREGLMDGRRGLSFELWMPTLCGSCNEDAPNMAWIVAAMAKSMHKTEALQNRSSVSKRTNSRNRASSQKNDTTKQWSTKFPNPGEQSHSQWPKEEYSQSVEKLPQLLEINPNLQEQNVDSNSFSLIRPLYWLNQYRGSNCKLRVHELWTGMRAVGARYELVQRMDAQCAQPTPPLAFKPTGILGSQVTLCVVPLVSRSRRPLRFYSTNHLEER